MIESTISYAIKTLVEVCSSSTNLRVRSTMFIPIFVKVVLKHRFIFGKGSLLNGDLLEKFS